jgi:formylmethanofuran dehydrogenase subunit C
MMKLSPVKEYKYPIIAECINPDVFDGKTCEEIERLEIWEGNKQKKLGGWTGSMMKGGTIEIHGNAGGYLGAPYRGSSEGMKGGKIIVSGNVGTEAGAHLRGGIIKIYGNAGQFVGFRMHDGTIYVQMDAGARTGACMIGGKIIVGGFLESVLPTFTIEGIKEKVKIEEGETAEGPFYLFLGDHTEHGEGKLYVFKKKNPHLSCYEKLL